MQGNKTSEGLDGSVKRLLWKHLGAATGFGALRRNFQQIIPKTLSSYEELVKQRGRCRKGGRRGEHEAAGHVN